MPRVQLNAPVSCDLSCQLCCKRAQDAPLEGGTNKREKKTGNACMVPICDLTCPSLLQLVNASAPPGWHIHKSGGGGPIWQRRHVTYAGLGWKAGEGNSVKLGPFVRSYLYLWSSPPFLSTVRRYIVTIESRAAFLRRGTGGARPCLAHIDAVCSRFAPF
jgi:hypothetical protein